MSKVTMTDTEFDELMETLNSVDMEADNYIPSDDDFFDYIEKHPERYYKYLLWYSEHKPIPTNEKEKEILKKITKIINNTVEIIFE